MYFEWIQYKAELHRLSDSYIIKNDIVKHLVDTALWYYDNDKYSTALFRYQHAIATDNSYENQIAELNKIVLKTIKLSMITLESENTRFW